jgi:DNA-directed RNA polymerase specialized sigma24 family protein
MTPRILTDEEYEALKKKLHQAHDKLIKSTLQDVEAMREFVQKILSQLLVGVKIDLDALTLDTTTYIRPNLQVFYSDIVYLTTITDESTNLKKRVKVGILVEHKSDMPTQLAMRLQALDYINAIMKRNYDKDADTTIPVIPIIFNQFDKDWTPLSVSKLFPDLSLAVTKFIPDFELLVINLASLSQETMDSLDKFGILKASFLAMKNVRNKTFLKRHFEDIFVFLQQHPDRTDLRDQLIAYLLGYSDMKAKDLEELLANIFSPVLKQEIMISGTGFLAVAAREAAAKERKEANKEIDSLKVVLQKAKEEAKKAREEAQKTREEAQKTREEAQKTREEAQEALYLKMRLTVMHGWYRGAALDLIADMADASLNEVRQLMSAFEKVKNYCQTNEEHDVKTLTQLSGLNEVEIKNLLTLLK